MLHYYFTCDIIMLNIEKEKERKMKPALIDKTLAYLHPARDNISADEYMAYCNALFACGADYIELKSDTAKILEKQDFSEKFILRISALTDLKLCCEKQFAYIVLPMGLSGITKKLSKMQSVIIEANADEYCADAMLRYITSSDYAENISMIRLTGVFGNTGDSLERLIKTHQNNSHIPLDICPLNTMMTGISDALAVYEGGGDALTLSFGRNNYYTSLEQFLINLQIAKGMPMRGDRIHGICAASLMFNALFGSVPIGLSRMLASEDEVNAMVYDSDSGVTIKSVRLPKGRDYERRESIIDRKIRSIGLERDIEEAIIETLKKESFGFYKSMLKNN